MGPEMETWNIGLFLLSMMDITFTSKWGKQGHAMSRMWYLNHQQISGTLTHNLAELENTSTTLQISQLSCSATEDGHLTHVHSHL